MIQIKTAIIVIFGGFVKKGKVLERFMGKNG